MNSLDLIFYIGILAFIILYGTGIILTIIFAGRIQSSIGKEVVLIRYGVEVSKTIEKMQAYGYELKELQDEPIKLVRMTFVKVR